MIGEKLIKEANIVKSDRTSDLRDAHAGGGKKLLCGIELRLIDISLRRDPVSVAKGFRNGVAAVMKFLGQLLEPERAVEMPVNIIQHALRIKCGSLALGACGGTFIKEGKKQCVASGVFHFVRVISSQHTLAKFMRKEEISAPLFAPKDIVIDFGLPVVIDYSGTEKRYNLKDGSGEEVGNYATYGTVSVSGNVVTYTPNTVLMGVDTVYLTNTAGGVYTFKVYPATTVYYEEDFMDFVGFTGGAKSTVAQTTEFVGEKRNAYGFDPAYNGSSTVSHTSAVSNAAGSTAEFTFTGTGVDIYADCTTDSGTVLIQVYNEKNDLVKMLTVNTAMVAGTTAVTSGEKQAQSANNVPIASIEGLSATPKEYEVVITHVGGTGTVKLDGFRVHGTLPLDTEAYQKDGESEILLQELRDAVLKIQLKATAESSDLTVRQDIKLYQEQMKKAMTSSGEPDTQVYKGVIISEMGGSVTQSGANSDNLVDLLDNGPKNEVYLAENETLVFTVKTSRNVQVGVKVLSGTGACSINNSSETVSETDMFYTVTPNADGTVIIKNPGSGTLAITELKFTDPKPTT